MTLQSLREWLASLEAAGVSPDEEILVDAVSETQDASFRCSLSGATMEHAHDENDTPFGVLIAEDIDDPEHDDYCPVHGTPGACSICEAP